MQSRTIRTTALDRHRHRRRRRGAAFVEAIIVISTFFVFLYGVMYFHSMFLSKWAALQEARAKAWIIALHGCEGVGGDSTQIFDGAVDKKDTPDDDIEIAAGFSENGFQNPGWFDTKKADVQVATHPSGPDVPADAKTYTVARVFSCNEPFNDDELEMGKGAPGFHSAIGDIIKELLIP